MSVFEECIMSLAWPTWLLFSSYPKEIYKGVQSGALLKMSPSSLSIEKFGLVIQK